MFWFPRGGNLKISVHSPENKIKYSFAAEVKHRYQKQTFAYSQSNRAENPWKYVAKYPITMSVSKWRQTYTIMGFLGILPP